MKKVYILLALLLGALATSAQQPGDTIRVQAFTFDSETRDTVINFPDESFSYEKILLKYTMRCSDGLVSTGADRNLGCGEWDYSCNTYIADSNKVESLPTAINSHFITNYEETVFPYKTTPVYDYMRGTQYTVAVASVDNETTATLAAGDETLNRVLSTDKAAGKAHYLYTADELSQAGVYAGSIHGIDLSILDQAGTADFMKVRMKNTSKSELNGLIDIDGFTEVYYKDTDLNANQSNRLQFHTPFVWDGSSNVLVEFNFTNVDTPLAASNIQGEATTGHMGLSATNEQEIVLTNNSYVEIDNYKGIGGNQNRTIEAWIRTTDGSNGEIIGWGTNVTGNKWVFRLNNGLLRLEVHGGGTVGSTRVDDGEWHHIACVLYGNDLGGINFYIDGVLDINSAVGTTAINTNAENGNVRISRGVNNRYLDATVDEVRIWDTNLSEETINAWKHLKVDSSHPNYANLSAYYEFNGSGNTITDSSPNNRTASLIGERYYLSEVSGPQLFKDFVLATERPQLTFYQGTYTTVVTETVVDRPIAKSNRHHVIERSIEVTDPNFAQDDNILIDGPVEYWLPEESIYDELTGELISENSLTPDGEITISELTYDRRFPFYNELLSFVTPYGIGLDLGREGATWIFDVTDYVSILKNNKRLLMTLGGQFQEEMDLEFQFIVGTPPRDVIQYEQLWQGTNRIGNATVSQILNDEKFAPMEVTVAADAATAKLRSSITGHGSEGEFQQNGGVMNHIINYNQIPIFNWNINKECSFNPIFPQGGTWVFDRQGWCPGERSTVTEHDLTALLTAGNTFTLDYNTTNPPVSGGDYRYHVAHQLVSYGGPNFQTDAAVVEVIAPNNSAEYTRIGTICNDPTIVIRNTGAEDLTSLTIKYWLNDSQSPQTYNWTGNLRFMRDKEVTIPAPPALWYDLLADNNKFYVEISAPNGGTDEYVYNNTFNTNFDFPEIIPNNFNVFVRTNNVAFENRYEIYDSNGEIVGSNNLLVNNTNYTDTYNLGNGCYKMLFIDSGQDGIEWWANPNQGSGLFTLRDESNSTIKTFEPDFGGGFEYNFSTSFPVSVDELKFITSIKLYPNPASQQVTLEAEDLSTTNISMINAIGQQVAAPLITKTDDSASFDIDHLESGIYYLVIQQDKVVTTRKLIVE